MSLKRLDVIAFQDRFGLTAFFLILLLILALVCHLAFGAVAIEAGELGRWLLGSADAQTNLIINQLRLPRALLALGVGVALAVSGCATQSLFKNPLADPSLIGVSAGASAGASLVIVGLAGNGHWQWLGFSLVSLGAFAGGLLVVWLVFRVSCARHGTSVLTMLLAGVAMSYLAGSLSQFLELIADHHMLKRISLWRMGGLEGADYRRALLMLVVGLGAALWLWHMRSALNVLLLGEAEAQHLGFEVKTLRWQIILCVSLAVGLSVALAGAIAFVGLIVPHMVRLWLGPDHRKLIPISALLGAVLLVAADCVARTSLAPMELPVGLLISVLGAPLFVVMLRQRLAHAPIG